MQGITSWGMKKLKLTGITMHNCGAGEFNHAILKLSFAETKTVG